MFRKILKRLGSIRILGQILKHFTFILSFLALVSPHAAIAETALELDHHPVIGLTVWQPHNSGLRYILPTLSGETPERVSSEYLTRFHQNPTYQKLIQSKDFQEPPVNFEDFHSFTDSKPKFAVIANRTGHMSDSDPFFMSIRNSFESHGAEVFVIPLGLESFMDARSWGNFNIWSQKTLPLWSRSEEAT